MHGKRQKKRPNHQWWAVAFFDLLGQRKSFLENEVALGVDDPEAVARLVRATQESVAVILRFHDLYKRFRTAYLQRPAPNLANLPPNIRAKAERWRRTSVKHVPFSDGLVVYFGLRPEPDHSPVLALHFLTMGAGMLAMLQVSAGKPIRGGIDAGTGIQTHGQLFGAGVAKAYELESLRAKWPRILVGDDLMTYLDTKLNVPPQDDVDEWNSGTAERIKETLFQDNDGKWAVDFLGPMFRRIPDGSGPPAPVSEVHRGYDQVRRALDYWRKKPCSSIDEENERKHIQDKYQYLADYFAHHAALWDLRP
jgi:hypothetical protein